MCHAHVFILANIIIFVLLAPVAKLMDARVDAATRAASADDIRIGMVMVGICMVYVMQIWVVRAAWNCGRCDGADR